MGQNRYHRQKRNSIRGRSEPGGRKEKKSCSIWIDLTIGLAIALGLTALGLVGGATLFYQGRFVGSEGAYRSAALGIMVASLLAGGAWVLFRRRGVERTGSIAVIAVYLLLRSILSFFL